MDKNYKTGYECARCDTDALSEIVTLVGDYSARLCTHCRNEWSLFIRPHDLWRAKNKLEVRGIMLTALTQADGNDRTAELAQVSVDNDAIMLELHAVAAQWVKDV